MKHLVYMIVGASVLLACETTPKTYTTAQAQAKCAEARRDAEGPRSNVTIGANSRTGLSTGVQISLNDKFIRGVDPQVAYDNCMQSLNIVDQ